MNALKLQLVMPAMEYLPGFKAALEKSWSPNTTRDVSGEMLGQIAQDAEAFVAGINASHVGRTIKMPDGTEMPCLPAITMWLWDGEFCGVINLRYVEGSDELPENVPGHMGYAVVPWKQRMGYATEALRRFLPEAWQRGLSEVTLRCDADNLPSQRVILASGGRMVKEFTIETGKVKRLFVISRL